ncbi:MAG: hypothetical protein GX264_09385 [Clostridiales bacterium]|jgi:alpha-D-xyloside xylohydrolase|nr:hypothetical protein [Clostridiales bacterium]
MAVVKRFFQMLLNYLLAFIFAFGSGGFKADPARPDPSLNAPEWPTWVHEHWVWENVGDENSAREFAYGFTERDIPVGAVIIDRPWATASNTFVPDPNLYPNLAELIDEFHSNDIRVIMWATSVVNEEAPNFQEGKEKGYFLSGGRTVKWWGGKGAFLDYSNPEAVEWWHNQMDNVLDMGIDGWKVDGTDPYVMLLAPAIGKSGIITWDTYKDQTYRDFYEYTREKLGKDRVISARPVDDQLTKLGLPLVSTSRDINFAGWVGDQDNDWSGLRHALNNMFSSAKFNHVSYGSDIGGFRNDGNQYKDVFIRWAQLGAFSPIMENGGSGEHRPWMYDDETTTIYRKYVKLHHELIPYIYSQAAYSYELVKPTIRPQLGEYTYMLGDEILVAPMFKEGNDRTVTFPEGEWIYMFDESKTYTKSVQTLTFGMDEFPAYIRNGAIIPLDVTDVESSFGSELNAGFTTVLMYPTEGTNKFGLYEENKTGTLLSYTKSGKNLTVTMTESDRSFLFRIFNQDAPKSVKLGEVSLAAAASMEELVAMESGYFYDGQILWLNVSDASAGAQVNIRF